MTISEMIDFLERRVPLTQQEDFDNSGVQCGDITQEIKGILVAIDITEAVVAEAIQKGCNLIVTHHPPLFRAIKHITPTYYIQRAIIEAIKHDIVLYASHTALDNDDEGVNIYWAKQIGLTDIRILALKPHQSNIGSGVIGNLPQPLSMQQLVERMKAFQPITRVAHSLLKSETIRCVAYCGGSGNFLMPKAMAEGADIFITGEARYNDFYDAEGEITLMTIGHFESELLTKDILIDLMSEKKGNFVIHYAQSCVNPVHYI